MLKDLDIEKNMKYYKEKLGTIHVTGKSRPRKNQRQLMKKYEMQEVPQRQHNSKEDTEVIKHRNFIKLM